MNHRFPAYIICLTIICCIFIPISLGSNVKIIQQNPVSNNRGYTLYVGGSGPNNYTKIQDAIDNTSYGDTVFVFKGIYNEFIVIDKTINLIGENKNLTIINGYFAFTISIISDYVNMSGFTIKNDRYSGEGIRIDSSYNHFFENIVDTPKDNIRISGEYNTISENKIMSDSMILLGDYNTILDNRITNNFHGIYFSESSDNIIKNNSFYKAGLFFSDGTVKNNIVINNMMNDKPLIYLSNKSQQILDDPAGQIILVNCFNIKIQNQVIINTTVGIQIWDSNNCEFSNNTISSNFYGFYIYGSDNKVNNNSIIENYYDGIRQYGDYNTISNNLILKNSNGIYLYNSDKNTIVNNIIKNNHYSIQLDFSCDYNIIKNNTLTDNNFGSLRITGNKNIISMNNVSSNKIGIYFSGMNNTISYNYISKNNLGIISQELTINNNIIFNNFLNNEEYAIDIGKNNWDNGKYGNYWSDYSLRYPDARKSLLKPWMWNTPYKIEGGNNKDNCPLVYQWPNSRPKNKIRNTPPDINYLQKYLDIFQDIQRMLNLNK